MEIVIERPPVAPQSARTPASTSITTNATSQQGLPIQLSQSQQHFSQHAVLYDVAAGTLLPANEYYARNYHELYDRNLEGALIQPIVRRVNKSGLLEVAETDLTLCPRPQVLTGAENVVARPSVSRVNRPRQLEAVLEDPDQPKKHCNNNGSESEEQETTANSGTAMTPTLEETQAVPQEEMLEIDPGMDSRVFDVACGPLERPSCLKRQVYETGMNDHSVGIEGLTSSPRQFDLSSIATERLPYLPSSSPSPSQRHPRNDPPRGSSFSTNLCVEADSAWLRNQRSPDFTVRYSPVNSTPRNLDTLTTSVTTSPITRERTPVGYSEDNFGHPTSININDLTVEAIKISRESSFVKGGAKQKNEDPVTEERAEAEGCEHTTVESIKENKVSFKKGSKKLLDNDNVDTLRVIILSEQL